MPKTATLDAIGSLNQAKNRQISVEFFNEIGQQRSTAKLNSLPDSGRVTSVHGRSVAFRERALLIRVEFYQPIQEHPDLIN